MRFFLVSLVLSSMGVPVLSIIHSGQPEGSIDLNDPVRNASSDEVTNLPGLSKPINFKHYSGYLKADVFDFAPSYLHYWFVESQDKPLNDPVLLWLNGGPGFSSLNGFFTEIGPFHIKGDTKELELNEYSWNKHANVLFLESPAEVGFSYCPTRKKLMHTDDTTAKGNYLALKSFMEKFPQFKKNKLYLAGESYAGVYLPTLGVLVDADPELNLRGIAIGNGYFDTSRIENSIVFFVYHHGLVGKTVWDEISKECCNSQPPARESCRLTVPYASKACQTALVPIGEAVFATGINPYGLYNKCVKNSKEERELSQIFKVHPLNLFSNISKPLGSNVKNITHQSPEKSIGAPCVDFHKIDRYLNDRDVRTALHIPTDLGGWVDNKFRSYLPQYPDRPNGLSPQVKHLIDSKRGLKILVYSGDTGVICNFLSSEWFVDDLGRKLVKDYAPWKVDGQVGGYFKIYDGIVYATVRGAGHMVSTDRPREAAKMIEGFLTAKGQYVEF